MPLVQFETSLSRSTTVVSVDEDTFHRPVMQLTQSTKRGDALLNLIGKTPLIPCSLNKRNARCGSNASFSTRAAASRTDWLERLSWTVKPWFASR